MAPSDETPPVSAAPSNSRLAAVGELRESLAAARNLEHLVSSINVSPKVIVEMLPEVAPLLGRFPSAVSSLVDILQDSLRLPSSVRVELPKAVRGGLSPLSEVLSAPSAERMPARQRLELERSLREAVPLLVAVVAHCELMLDAAETLPVCIGLGELLAPHAGRGSDRPLRRIPITGQVDGVVCRVPPRMASLAVAAYVAHEESRQQAGQQWRLLVERSAGTRCRLVLRTGTSEPGSFMAALPTFHPMPFTPAVVRAALEQHGGAWSDQGLLLPLE